MSFVENETKASSKTSIKGSCLKISDSKESSQAQIGEKQSAKVSSKTSLLRSNEFKASHYSLTNEKCLAEESKSTSSKIWTINENEPNEKDFDQSRNEILPSSSKEFLIGLKNNPIFKDKLSNFENYENLLNDKNCEDDLNTVVDDFLKSLNKLIKKKLDNEQTKAEYVHKKVRSLLNNVGAHNYECRANQIQELPIETEEILQNVADQVFYKALEEPKNSIGFAMLSKHLANIEVTTSEGKIVTLRQLLINRCHNDIEKMIVDELALNKKFKDFRSTTTLGDDEKTIRTKLFRTIRFIGELFNQEMIPTKTVDQCIKHLLNQINEENLEFLCEFVSAVGKELELRKANLSIYFKKLQSLAIDKGKVSPRIRMMLLNLIILRDNEWVLVETNQKVES